MNDHDSSALRGSVENAIALFRGDQSRFRAALAPIVDSLEALCRSLQETAGPAGSADCHAAVLVITRDLIASALHELEPTDDEEARAMMLALATVHNRIVAALDACVVRA